MAFLPHNTPLLFQNYLAWGVKSTIFDDAPELNRLLKLKYAAEIQNKSQPLLLICGSALAFSRMLLLCISR